MTSRHSRVPSDMDRESFAGNPGGLTRAAPIMPLGMPPMTREAKESKEQAQAWDASLNKIFQTMHGEDTAKYLAYFKARLEIEETYSRSLEKLTTSAKGGSKSSSSNNNNNGGSNNNNGSNNAAGGGAGGQGGTGSNSPDPEEIPTTLCMAYDALLDTTQQLYMRRRPFVRLLKTLTGALASLKEAHEKQRKSQKETVRPVFQLYAETRLSTVPKIKRAYEQRCREVEQVLAIEDSDHLPVRERLKNLASSSGAAGRLVKNKRDMEEADNEYKTAVQSLEVYRIQRERCFDSAFQTMQTMIKERGTKCRQCLEAYVVGERDLIAGAKEDMDRFSIVVDCIKPVGDMDQINLTFTKDINSHPKPVLYENYYQKSASESIFGMRLPDYVRRYRHPIPLVIVKCSEAIDRAGLRREGIYRVSGRHAQIMNLKKQFDLNEETVDLADPAFSEDCASIAAVLKIYLRELPEPLFPFPLGERVAYSGIPDKNIRLGELKGRLKRLPDCNIDTLQFLIQHLRRIHEHVEENKMTLENLSMIFTPAIFHDFNSALVTGPQPPERSSGESTSNNTSTALSFAPQTQPQAGSTSPSMNSPGVQTAPWSSYPLPPADQKNQQQQPQQLQPQQGQQYQQYQQHQQHQNTSLGHGYTSSPSSPRMPSDANAVAPGSGSGSAAYIPPPTVGGSANTSALVLGSSMASPSLLSVATTTSTFAPPTNTVSAAASWSNDLVLADLILNSNTIFDVLPKLPARTNSMMMVDDRYLANSMANASISPSLQTRGFDNSRRSYGLNPGIVQPSSPVEGGSGQLRPRFDSLGPNSATRVPTTATTMTTGAAFDQAQGQAHPYQLPQSHLQHQQLPSSYGYHDGWQQAQVRRAGTPPSPSSLKGLNTHASPTRSKSNMDLQNLPQQFQQPPQQQHRQL